MLRRWTDYRREQLQGLSTKNLKPSERLSIVKHVKLIRTYDFIVQSCVIRNLSYRNYGALPFSFCPAIDVFLQVQLDFWPHWGCHFGGQAPSGMSAISSDSTARINAARFAKRATTLLKAASSSGIDASLLSQMKASIAVFSRQQAGGNGSVEGVDKKQLVELEELRNLVKVTVPIAAPVRGQGLLPGKEAVSEEDTGDDDISRTPKQTGSKAVSHKKKAGSAARPQHSTLSEGAVAVGEASVADAHDAPDTTSAEKITSLLQQSKDISAQDLEQEQHKHNQLLGQVSELVGSLKEATLLMNKLVVEQNVQLDEITQVAAENMDELSDQREKMKEATKEMGTSVWTTVGTLLWLMIMFAVTYMVMRLFPKPVP